MPVARRTQVEHKAGRDIVDVLKPACMGTQTHDIFKSSVIWLGKNTAPFSVFLTGEHKKSVEISTLGHLAVQATFFHDRAGPIRFCTSARMKIFFRTNSVTRMEPIAVEVDPSDTIEAVKTKLQEQEGFPSDKQVLSREGEQLRNSLTLADLEIVDECTLDLTAVRPLRVLVNKKPSGQTYTIEVEPDELIERLKAKVKERSGIVPEEQRLTFGKASLDDNTRSVKECGIEEQSNIDLVVVLQGEMKLNVRTTSGATVSVAVQRSDTIATVKTKIHEVEGTPPARQHLTFIGKELAETRTLCYYNIRSGAIFYLRRRTKTRLRPSCCTHQ